nr:MAG TPA: hypothetical protein [Caudoviricetes sp.]
MKARGKRGTGSRCREAGNAASGQDRAGIRCGILLDVLVKPHDLTALQCKILLFALGKEILPGALAGKLQSCGLLCKGVIKLHVLKALGGALLCLCGLFGFLLGFQLCRCRLVQLVQQRGEPLRVGRVQQVKESCVIAFGLAMIFTGCAALFLLHGLFTLLHGGFPLIQSGCTLVLFGCACLYSIQSFADDVVYFFLGEHLLSGAVSLRLSVCLLGGVRGVVVGHGDFLSRPVTCGRYSDGCAICQFYDVGGAAISTNTGQNCTKNRHREPPKRFPCALSANRSARRYSMPYSLLYHIYRGMVNRFTWCYAVFPVL